MANAVVQVIGEGTAANSGIAGEISIYRLTATAFTLLLSDFIIFGGIKRIAHFAEVVVPFMAIAYIGLALIIGDAFSPQVGFGAAIGRGVKRGIYSNEAGQGSGAHPAAAADVEHPVQQGLIQAFSVYITMLLVCSVIALVILMTKQYNIVADQAFAGAGTQYIASYLHDAADAVIHADPNLPAFTQIGMESVFGKIGPVLVAIAIFFIGVGMTTWLNIIGMLIIFLTVGRPTIVALRDYERQQKANLPVYTFDPQALGIKGATFWEEKLQRQQEDKAVQPPPGDL
ncbi:Na+/alanine symporter [Cardiobacterium valvarum]|uniref:Na+/alanine symporter n=1 Tax=Cardiobacterium valvarum TaxID=194702 RepID=A0A381E5V2_9GAMM|nr:alanine:cation symporter family protein [Cardiobacterium valvarum]SUX21884.1 Na+/alanine symporter [Cardiobacterium valvarum]